MMLLMGERQKKKEKGQAAAWLPMHDWVARARPNQTTNE